MIAVIFSPFIRMASRLNQMNWGILFILSLVASIGFTLLYSAAGGSFTPWAEKQMVRFLIGFVFLVAIAVTDIRVWLSQAYTLYGASLILLVFVEISGFIGKGAERWINLYVFHLQPSELMKITVILALARYFHHVPIPNVQRMRYLIVPVMIIAAPVFLVLRQPDLGTAVLFSAVGGTVIFLAGMRAWKVWAITGSLVGSLPILWSFLHNYQRQRVLTFLNPERDPLGAGYHISQSKIALGSGGFFGKGFMKGTQSYLNFLPEKQTDFIFTMYLEEFGMLGGLTLLGLYGILIGYGYVVSFRSRSHFGRLLSLGITTMLFLYVFINVAMVMGLVPVVGVPLPLISYGGTSMMTILMGMGFLMSIDVYKNRRIGRPGYGAVD